MSDAKESLKLVMNSIDDDMPEDFYSIDLMSAYESLGLIIGESVEDDLMDEIFSKFCMGSRQLCAVSLLKKIMMLL